MQDIARSGFARVVEVVCDALLYVATAGGILITVFVALSSMMRYAIGKPFAFTEELVGLLFSTMVFLSLPYCTLRRRHIEVTLLTDRFPPALRRVSALTSALLVLLFCIWYGTFAWEFVLVSWQLHSKSDMGGILLWPWMASMFVSCVLIGAAILALWATGHLQQGEGSSGG